MLGLRVLSEEPNPGAPTIAEERVIVMAEAISSGVSAVDRGCTPDHPTMRFAISQDLPASRFAVSGGEGGSSMGATTEMIRLGDRWAAALKRRYPGRLPGSLDAKRCAQAFEVSPRTAESWAAGQGPRVENIERAWLLHGAAFAAEVLSPGEDIERLARMDQMVDELETKFEAMGREIKQLRADRKSGVSAR
jgi:hypothetical protein